MLYIIHWVDAIKKVHTMRTRSIGKAFATAMCNRKPIAVVAYDFTGEKPSSEIAMINSNDAAMTFFTVLREREENIET
jgi:hypothetical protein